MNTRTSENSKSIISGTKMFKFNDTNNNTLNRFDAVSVFGTRYAVEHNWYVGCLKRVTLFSLCGLNCDCSATLKLLNIGYNQF